MHFTRTLEHSLKALLWNTLKMHFLLITGYASNNFSADILLKKILAQKTSRPVFGIFEHFIFYDVKIEL
jgi:hypothetical protein